MVLFLVFDFHPCRNNTIGIFFEYKKQAKNGHDAYFGHQNLASFNNFCQTGFFTKCI